MAPSVMPCSAACLVMDSISSAWRISRTITGAFLAVRSHSCARGKVLPKAWGEAGHAGEHGRGGDDGGDQASGDVVAVAGDGDRGRQDGGGVQKFDVGR